MANKTFQGRIIQKHDTKAKWDKATNFVPLKGEIIIYDDLKKIKIGDGTTKVGSLTFINNLPIATKDVLGGIKKGNNIIIFDYLLLINKNICYEDINKTINEKCTNILNDNPKKERLLCYK